MHKLHFLSNIVINPVYSKVAKVLGEGFEISCSDIGQIEQFLLSETKVDTLVLVVTSKYFFQTNGYKDIDERLETLLSMVSNYQLKSGANILLSNFWDASSSVSFQESDRIENNYHIVRSNNKIFESSSQSPSFQVLNLFDIVLKVGEDNFYRRKTDLLYQMPFSLLAIDCIVDEILLKLNLLNGQNRKKLCLVDGDNTLWGGVLGEESVQGVSCDQNYPGVVYWMFQRQLIELKKTGVLLGLISKNNEQDIRELFMKRDFPLKIEDFSVLMVNWDPKSLNIQASVDSLNIGLDSVVFIDDSDFEIESVQRILPQVLSIQFDLSDLEANLSLLSNIPSFQTSVLTTEDMNKVGQYQQEFKRREARHIFDNVGSYIKSLGIEIEYSINERVNLQRVVQLFNKTNQFNLTTIRYQASQIEELYKKGLVFDFRVRDKFGDMGIVGAAVVVDGCIENLVLSCRALGRNIEFKIVEIIQQHIGKDMHAKFIPSKKNQQTKDFYEQCSFKLNNKSDNGKSYSYQYSKLEESAYSYISYIDLNKE